MKLESIKNEKFVLSNEEMGSLVGGDLVQAESPAGVHSITVPGIGVLSTPYSSDCITTNTETGNVAKIDRYSYEADSVTNFKPCND